MITDLGGKVNIISKLLHTAPIDWVQAARRGLKHNPEVSHNGYQDWLQSHVFEFIEKKYPEHVLAKESFIELLNKRANRQACRQANTFCADLWELYYPDYKNRFSDYYKWQSPLLFVTFLSYANNPSMIDDIYYKSYQMAIRRLGKLDILEIGGGVPHGFLKSIMKWGSDFCNSLTYIDIEALHTDFVKRFCLKYNLNLTVKVAEASVRPELADLDPFNYVFAKDVFEHLDDPESLLIDLLKRISSKCVLALDLKDHGAVVYQHINPNLEHLQKHLSSFEVDAETGNWFLSS